MHLVSVNLSDAKTLTVGKKSQLTGIFKEACDTSMHVGPLGVTGDTIINTKFHGGLDQAIYCYHLEDYQWWEEKLGQPLPPGTFGENFTLQGLVNIDFRVGDRLKINDVVLELTSPRVPCATFAARMGDTTFLKEFVTANRSGAYARVIQAGNVSRGNAVDFIPNRENYPTLKDVFHHRHSKQPDPDVLRQAIASPISEKLRPNLEERLDSLKPR
ncbi:MOSC domain-containing protein [Aurantivibrio plasticivorans]